MSEVEVDQMIQLLHQRVEDLQREAVQAGSVDHLHSKASQELQNTLEELHVTQEELRQQNDELLVTHRVLEVERQRYQDLFDFASDGYLVTDTHGVIKEANRAAGLLLGVAAEQLRGKPLPLFVHEKERAAFRLQFAQVNCRYPTREREIMLQPRQGPAFSAALTACAINDEKGTAIALRWLLRDISVRRQAAESLRQERDFADNLLTLARAIVLLCDPQGRVIRCSPYMEKISGYRLEEVQGKDWFTAFLAPAARARSQEAFWHSLSDHGSCRDVYPILTRAGGQREIEWYSKALRGDKGQVTSVLAVGHDITELKEAQERALQAERLAAIGQMATGLAHEGRNALQRGMACLGKQRWTAGPR